MNLEFMQCTANEHCVEVHNILKSCGQNMYEKKGLCHWKRPYDVERIRNDLETKAIFLVKYQGKIAATFSLDKKPSTFFEDNVSAIYLSKFAVLPELEGKGIGGECMKFIENYAKDENCRALRLDVYDKSLDAVRFYEHKGFKTLYSRKTTNFEVLCMEKLLER